MEIKKLTVKDSSLAFFVGFLFSQFAVIIATCIISIIGNIMNIDSDTLLTFINTGIGYLICAFAMNIGLLCVFFFFNKHKENQIISKPTIQKILVYTGIAIVSFFMLYPIVICADSLLIKCGISLNSIPYTLDTKNYILSIFSLVIAPAICEELLFRGLIFKGLKRHGKAFSIIITAVMFTIFHLSISQTVYPLLMGLLLSFVMYRENNIIYCILIHMINNFISLTLSYAGVSLIFNHWTYIMLAIVLAVIFISILLICILKDNKKEDPIDRSGKIFLVCSLIIMSIIWLLNNIL